jgi:hypothetical protein
MKHENNEHNTSHYAKLFIMAVLSFICMYILMYAMVNTRSDVFMNVNQFYMAGLMTMPMIIIEVILMGGIYANKKLNASLIGLAVIGVIAFYALIRQQSSVNDKQFLKSMIPHHSGAILMCEQADIKDPQVKKLCETIISGQRQEIEQMKSKLKELEK